MTYGIALILALIQGITEFLPISSSGHLVIAQKIFQWTQENVLLDAVLHLGTAVAIGIVFRKDILELINGVFSKDESRKKASFRYMSFILIGSLPAGLAGLLFLNFFERMLLNAHLTSFLFLATAFILFATALRKNGTALLDGKKAILIGAAQALAILPGLSRSGITISAALLLGIDRKEAGRFSFLLGMPAIVGAAVLEIWKKTSLSIPLGVLLGAFAASAIVGTAALRLLLCFVTRGKLHYFGYYLLVLGLVCLLFL